VYHFPGRDGAELAWRELGAGRPLVLLHGLLGSGALLADSGPARPHDPASSRTDGHRRVLTALARGEVFEEGTAQAQQAAWISGTGADPQAVRCVLDAFVATPADALRQVPTPTLIVTGDRDSRGASAGALAGLLPFASVVQVPGDHFTALGAPEFTRALLAFLGGS